MKIYYIKDDKCLDLTPRLPELSREDEIKLAKLGITSLFVIEALTGTQLYADTNIANAVQPLVNVLIDLAEPVSYGFMVKGFFEMMSGADSTGKKTIKHAVAGYLGIRFIPQIFNVIKGINLVG